MKNYLLVLIIMCFMPSFLFADEVDDKLPSETPSHIKESAKLLIRLGLENQGVIKITRVMVEKKYKEQQMLEVHQILMNAKEQGLSEGPIMNKFYECTAKKQKTENIIMAMETVRSRYETAIGYAGMISRNKEQASIMTEEIVQCMSAGIADLDMKRMMELLQKKTKDMKTEETQTLTNGTLNTIKIMARAGAESGSVTDLIVNAFQRSYTANDMEKLGNAFTKQTKGSSSASALADTFADDIRNGATVDNVGNFSSGTSDSNLGNGSSGSNP